MQMYRICQDYRSSTVCSGRDKKNRDRKRDRESEIHRNAMMGHTDTECIGICTLNEHLICNGCGRTMHEIETAGGRRSLPIVIHQFPKT